MEDKAPSDGRTASILHADLDAFYVSVERLKRPDLVGKPVAVGGGVIVSASYEARKFGVDAPMPIRQARELCPRLIVVGGSFADYIELSDKVFEICRRYTPFIEQISIDEAFLDVAGAGHLFGPPAAIAAAIRMDVSAEAGLPISIGVARSKFLAKVASQAAKPDGLLVVPPEGELDFLHPLPVRAIWGVGPATAAKLAQMGIDTVGELAESRPEFLTSRLGRAAGDHLHHLAWNVDRRHVERHHTAGSVGAQRTFGRDVKNRGEHRAILMAIADRVGGRLRKKDRAGRTVTVRVRFSDFQAVTRSTTLRAAVASTESLFRIADQLVDVALSEAAEGRGLRLLGISVSKLVHSPHLQLELPLVTGGREDAVARAGSAASLARDRLDAAIDDLRSRFGKTAVASASSVMKGRRLVPEEFGDLAIPVAERSGD